MTRPRWPRKGERVIDRMSGKTCTVLPQDRLPKRFRGIGPVFEVRETTGRRRHFVYGIGSEGIAWDRAPRAKARGGRAGR